MSPRHRLVASAAGYDVPGNFLPDARQRLRIGDGTPTLFGREQPVEQRFDAVGEWSRGPDGEQGAQQGAVPRLTVAGRDAGRERLQHGIG